MLTVHRAQGAEPLVTALGEVLRRPLADPVAAEVVAVPAKGVERWITQRLAGVLGAVDGDGVAAGLAFPSPSRLVDEALAAATGVAADDDPWAPGRVLWALVDVVDACTGEPWCGALTRHLAGEHGRTRRWATAAHLARLLRDYAAARPEALVDWAQGRDTDGAGGALPDDLRWQAELFRRLRARVGTPSPAERLEGACARLRDDPAASDLPERLSVFGPTRLTTAQLAVLDALGAARDVHLWLPHPSPRGWERLRGARPPRRRREDGTALDVVHPLLASLGRDTRELQLRLGGAPDVLHPSPPRAPSLLHALQDDLAEDRAPSPAPADGSVEVHACHGPARQVEVLREVLLHAFADDPALEPRDVLVLCPDVEAYAPLVRAAFGQGAAGGHPGHRLRVRLADRALRRTNPLLDVVASVLELADGRVTASQVLDLAALEPVRRCFSFDEDDLERLRGWAGAAGVRWGLGPRQREAHGLHDVALQGTWRSGLDRVLVGVAADETGLAWLGTALPLDDVDSSDIDLAGRLAELLDRLHAVLWRLQPEGGAQAATAWTAHLATALDLLTATRERDAWQGAQARRELAEATEHAGEVALRLPDVRALLAERLAGRPTRANFRTGELTVCTMVPMRSVPHRLVALLGLDDDVFPRGAGVDGDDLLARDPCPGERDRRSEDRQLLLDAVLSAGERLVVLYSGADPVSGVRRPPAVPVGELLDVLERMTGTDLVRRHPLQPFDPGDFAAAAPFSHDRSALAGAVAGQGVRVAVPAFLPAPLPPVAGDVALADLVAFVQHPVQAFLRQRLQVRVPEQEDDVLDALRAELDGLARWDVGERMLAARLRGVDVDAFRRAEWRRGTLPPLRLGRVLLGDVERTVEVVATAAAPSLVGALRALDVDVDLGDGRALTGTVTGVHGAALARASTSTLAPRHRLAAWVRLLALAAAHDGEWRAVTTGKGPGRALARTATAAAPDRLAARALLADLVALRDEGLRAPLPYAPDASAAYAVFRRSHDRAEAEQAAGTAFDGMFGDVHDRHLRHVHGPALELGHLLAEPDDGPERTRFGAVARRLWEPLLAVERLEVARG